jgi:large subunit ribosomal protein L4
MKIIEDFKLNKERMAEVSPSLLAQAVRVYQANQRQVSRPAKTRSQVAGTNKKMYRQKGTGRARHSDAKAPIFVGGGVAHGPKARDYQRRLPQKMKNLALKGALFLKNKEKKIVGVSGLAQIAGKTRELANLLPKEKVLIVTSKPLENVYRAAGNLPKVAVKTVADLNALDVLKAGVIWWDEEIDGQVKAQKVKTKSRKNSPKEVKP